MNRPSDTSTDPLPARGPSAGPPAVVAERRVAVLGPGLLGGSIALALVARQPGVAVSLWGRRPAFIDELRRHEWSGLATTDLAEAVDNASLVVLATPVGVMPQLAARLVDIGLADDALVTDVGSVKQPVVDQLTPLLAGTGVGFVGSHPMAGSEQTGMAAARADLFGGACCILTPRPAARGHDAAGDSAAPAGPSAPSEPWPDDDPRLARLAAFWLGLGCRVKYLPPQQHDAIMARISHLPHLVAALLVNQAIDGAGEGGVAALTSAAGPGFRDTTRVAAGDADMWTEILLENRHALVPLLQGLHQRVGSTLEILERMDDVALRSALEQARHWRRERFSFSNHHA